ncbi:flagellar hook protein [Sphingorhabdus soli]|uniref:Flagellar hook-associated protein 2 n=1 Tax=Flavisphingopyxis soli TaxID=2601267 RepID=A0A5C6U729_9SPHN|nr:flagellar filament capping protein FliD [Sphingorhabdus soli]TXC68747.1 flagellar hook protein [Sphingorhabdus soli]
MLSSISNLISGQSGINSGQLVADLVAATRQPREATIQQKQQLNSARISALASASSSLNTFADALSGILDGRRFAGDLVSSNGGVATASFIDGQKPQGLPVSLEVKQLAAEQRIISRNFTGPDAAVGTGTLTLTTSTGAFDIIIDATNDSLAGLRDAINTADAGVTAKIVSDNRGTRLVVSGKQGANESFSIAAPGPDPITGAPSPLTDFAYASGSTTGMAKVSDAADSIVMMDGIELVNSSNVIENAIVGVRLNLLSAAPGAAITISGDKPVATTRDLVSEFIDAYNTLKRGLNTATAPGTDSASGGPLAGNRAIRDMTTRLGRMSSAILSTDGPFRTLADIGVRTARDGTLELDSPTFDRAMAADPTAVAQMLDPVTPDANHPGLAGTLDAVRTALQDANSPLTLAKARFAQVNKQLDDLRTKLDDDINRYQANLQQTFSNMDRQLAILRQTQQYVDQQASIWNGSNKN